MMDQLFIDHLMYWRMEELYPYFVLIFKFKESLIKK